MKKYGFGCSRCDHVINNRKRSLFNIPKRVCRNADEEDEKKNATRNHFSFANYSNTILSCSLLLLFSCFKWIVAYNNEGNKICECAKSQMRKLLAVQRTNEIRKIAYIISLFLQRFFFLLCPFAHVGFILLLHLPGDCTQKISKTIRYDDMTIILWMQLLPTDKNFWFTIKYLIHLNVLIYWLNSALNSSLICINSSKIYCIVHKNAHFSFYTSQLSTATITWNCFSTYKRDSYPIAKVKCHSFVGFLCFLVVVRVRTNKRANRIAYYAVLRSPDYKNSMELWQLSDSMKVISKMSIVECAL